MDKLSIPAWEALQRADREALALGHAAVGVPHVLLGLAAAPGGGARRALLRRGIVPETVRPLVARLLPPRSEPTIELDRTSIERLVHALQHLDAFSSVARPVTTGDLLLAVLVARDRVTDAIAAQLGLAARALQRALATEEHAAPEPGRAVLRARPAVDPRAVAGAAAERPVSAEFEVLLDIRSLLRSLARRHTDGLATALEARVASELEEALADARLRLAEERRGCIGAPRRDELAQRRFVSTLRQAYEDARATLQASPSAVAAEAVGPRSG